MYYMPLSHYDIHMVMRITNYGMQAIPNIAVISTL